MILTSTVLGLLRRQGPCPTGVPPLLSSQPGVAAQETGGPEIFREGPHVAHEARTRRGEAVSVSQALKVIHIVSSLVHRSYINDAQLSN